MIPLHVHSSYSFLEGTIPPEQLIDTAIAYGLPAIALTDTNGMHGLINFYKKASEKNIKPLLGAYIDDPSDKKIYALFIAKNLKGYSDLCKIITTRRLKENFSLVDLLQNDFPDLFIITHSLELLDKIPNKQNIFAELISAEKEKRKTRYLYEYCLSKRIKFIASNPIYFLKKEDFIIHKTVTAIKHRQTIENVDHSNLADEEFYFKDPNQLKKLWRNLPEALENVEHIVQSCDVDLKLNQYKYPVFPSSQNSFIFLHELAYEGLRQRYKIISSAAEERLTMELRVIDELFLSDYFLVVWDILKEAKRRRMMTIGRGSAANSIVSYCLGFTEIDPIKHNLFFERFLNKSRKSPPDIDIDFSWKERDEIVRYVFDKYGYEHVAFISTHVTFKARSAFRETAKAFGFSDREISKVSKFIPGTNAAKLPDIPKLFPEAKNLKLDMEPWKSIVKIAARLAGFPRHLSIHPGGIVIAPQPITDYTALEFASNKGLGLIITQPDMHGIEDIGLVKIDLLSQRSLGVVRDTIKQIGINNFQFYKREPLRLAALYK